MSSDGELRPPVVAVDAFGSDRSPAVEVEGALLAAGEGRRVLLVGDEQALKGELRRQGVARPEDRGLQLHHASQRITMEDHPAQALRRKPDASMRVACELVGRGVADAAVSAGNSGAMMACALFLLGRLPGVDRPAIATVFPTLGGQSVLLDMGANVDCRPQQLAQFALMGAVYARLVLGRPRPRVGLLSNGAEDGKGTDATREALRLLRALDGSEAGHELVGYVEGRDIWSGQVDAIVCDGFVGNVVLKTCEGLADTIFRLLRDEVKRRWIYALGAYLMKGAFRALKRRMDYAETGGAPLLGIDGVAVICHGGSTPSAIKNAIRVAERYAREDLCGRMAAELARHAPVLESARERLALERGAS